ncbi:MULTISPECIES: ABC transporter permease [Leuconostoc]|uniref:ABC transporter permease n=1 Tax=Leuconostoc kimchii TaxID=136609 RepID=A0ABX5SMX3_9LACO|nr:MULTISPECIES: ABC transporter permease [Leuconostoc]KAA8326050.1 ABC transporter permease [Leuconostoc carnosum]QBR47878.1 ABC transporter permease [Leuconostoc kimchii]SPO32948.1 ABC transporter permease [Leuconostoc carnosum]
MINALKIIWEQIKYFPLIVRMVRYGDQSTYQNFFLGEAWKIINPILQVSVYFVVFGFGLGQSRSGHSNPAEYLAWMLLGMAIWRFMNEAVMEGSQSIKRQIGMVSKMKFPLSVLPAISIASAIWTFLALFGLATIIMVIGGLGVSVNWPWTIYYLLATILFSYSFSLFNSTIIILIPDYISILRLVMMMTMWVGGVIFKISTFDNIIGDILRLLPFNYVVDGIRDAWFKPDLNFDQTFIPATIIFWSLVSVFLLLGAYFHNKFKKSFIEYL